MQKKENNKEIYVLIRNGWRMIFDIFYNYIIKMIDQRLPSQITYSQIIPKGFPCVYKQWNLDPMSSNKQWANNDIVRFNFMNMGKGVFDTYRSYIKITVSSNKQNLPVGLLQIDSSAQSFIQQLVLYSNNRQVQRITQYSTIAAYLNDIGLNQNISQGRQSQGLGFGSFDTMPTPRAQNTNQCIMRRQNSGSDYSGTFSTGNIFPTIGNSYPQNVQYLNMNSIYNCARQAKGHVTNSNPIMTKSDYNGGNIYYSSTGVQACMNYTGWANNVRSQYFTNFIAPKFPQSTTSIPNYEMQIAATTTNNNQYPYKFNQNSPVSYDITQRTNYATTLYYDQYYSPSPINHVINTSNFGFTCLYSPNYVRGCFQPFVSPTIPQTMIQNGQITPTKIPIFRKTFKIPVISGVIGCLIDPSQFKLIPLESINSLLMQLTLDPYAMFTSGYNDFCQLDDQGMKVQQTRSYVIERIEYKLQTYFFLDNQISQYIQSSLTKQIVMTTAFWSLSNQFQVPGGAPVNNSYIIGCNSTHLVEIVCLFVSNDYQPYSFCRKHFRNSNNITKFWSKIGVQYWPPQPIKGNGGNVNSNNIDDDNSNFIENIYWYAGYMFTKCPLPRINPYNFAINGRLYDPTNKNTFYDPNMFNNQSYAFKANSVNSDTAMGMSWIHQNRYVGKAAYVINYTPFSHSDHILQGINVSKTSNFQVVFEQNGNTTQTRDQTLYIFSKSMVVVTYTKEGIRTYGR